MRDQGRSRNDLENQLQKTMAENDLRQTIHIVKQVYESPLSGDKLVESLLDKRCKDQLFGAAQKAPSQLSFYGVEIGKPLQLPECPKEKDQTNLMRLIVGVRYKCVQYGDAPGDIGRAWVRFPSGEEPLNSSGSGFTVAIVDGTVQLAELMTSGLMSQGLVLQELTAKYGPPTKSDILKATNRAGATFDNISASWDLGDLQVRFLGMVARTDQGYLWVGTRRGFEEDAARQKARDAASPRPKM